MRVTAADHQTPLGTMWSVWTGRGLYSLNWQPPQWITPGWETTDPLPQIAGQIDQFRARLDAFFETGKESFADIGVDPTGWTEFSTRVYECCQSIPPATTLTYQQLADQAGNGNASRAVGAAMSRNRILLVIPCHRVVAAGGQLRGFSAPGGLTTKRSLLELERHGHWPAELLANEPAR